MKNKFTLILLLVILALTPVVVHAQEEFDVGGGGIQLLEPIRIFFFPIDPSLFNVENFSILSWLTFAGQIVIAIAVGLFIFRILKAGVDAVRSEGDETKLQDSYKKIQANLVGAAVVFVIPIILIIAGIFLGIGPIWQWPKMLSLCSERSDYEYYFQAYLNAPPEDANPDMWAVEHCF